MEESVIMARETSILLLLLGKLTHVFVHMLHFILKTPHGGTRQCADHYYFPPASIFRLRNCLQNQSNKIHQTVGLDSLSLNSYLIIHSRMVVIDHQPLRRVVFCFLFVIFVPEFFIHALIMQKWHLKGNHPREISSLIQNNEVWQCATNFF